MEADATRECRRAVDLGRSNQATIMDRLKVLAVKPVGGHHVPGQIARELKRRPGDKFIRSAIEEKWQRKKRCGAVEKEQQSVPHLDGVCPLPGDRGNVLFRRYVAAHAVRAILPMVKRTADAVAHNLTAAQIGRQMRAAGVHDHRLPSISQVRNETTPQYVFGHRATSQFARYA